MKPTYTPAFISLVGLWALIESGLGGIMHALHLPFTGFFVGGFAVLIIGLIAQLTENSFILILKATILVILIKAAVNPITSPTAYIAVGFQGLLGSMLFYRKNWVKPMAIPFAVLAMFESAAQKLLLLFLFFGKTFLEALDLFIDKVLGIFSISEDISYSLWIIVVYLTIYSVWGVVLGIWIRTLPQMLQRRKGNYLHLEKENLEIKNHQQRKKSIRPIIYISIGAAIILLFSYLFGPKKGFDTAVFMVVRTSMVLVLWFLIAIPAFRFMLAKLNKRASKSNLLPFIHSEANQLKSWIKPLYKHLKGKHRGLYLYKELALGLMVISLYRNEQQ
jgi:hypothetical protein